MLAKVKDASGRIGIFKEKIIILFWKTTVWKTSRDPYLSLLRLLLGLVNADNFPHCPAYIIIK